MLWVNCPGKDARNSVSCTTLLVVLIALALSAQATGARALDVTNNGVDSPSCGPSANPCRSITQAIANAAAGDRIIMGPGSYGDLNGDGILGNSPGEELPPTPCNCMLLIDKSVTLISSDGASETVIDARTAANLGSNVFISADNVKFGASGQGFTVTNTLTPPQDETATKGITVLADQVSVKGNRVVVVASNGIPFTGIAAGSLPTDMSTVLIEGNQVSGWFQGIGADGPNVTISQNTAQLNNVGIAIDAGLAKMNVVTGNVIGIRFFGRGEKAVRNAVLGNQSGFDATSGGDLENNNIYGNGCGVLVGFSSPLISTVLAENNYWGATTGPGPDPADSVCGSNAGAAIVNPFSNKPFRVNLTVTP
jgi:hypothetical protein